jgi:hypothetical protein
MRIPETVFWVAAMGLGAASVVGNGYRKDKTPAGISRHRRFTYCFALLFGLVPLTSGGGWLILVTVPLADVVAHFWLLGSDRTTTSRESR